MKQQLRNESSVQHDCHTLWRIQERWPTYYTYIHIYLFQATMAHRTDKTVQKQIHDRAEQETTATQTDQRETVQYDCGT